MAVLQEGRGEETKKLRAPSTATFDNITLTQGTPPEVAAFFSVDAEDEFGQVVRSWALCAFDPTDGRTFIMFHEDFKDDVITGAADPSLHHRPKDGD